MITRRSLLASGFAAGLALPHMAWASADTDRRFIFILQRGAADGLSILAPVGDPAYAGLRGALVDEGGAKLDSLFSLHPAMPQCAALFGQKQAMFAHAVASAYRERSHFDGQNMLETGASRPYGRDDGWMNRLLTLLPGGERRALSLTAAVPTILRGSMEAGSYAPSRLPDADSGLMERVAMLYAEDAQLAPLWASAVETEMMAGDADPVTRGGAAAGKLAARLMAGPTGARVMLVESNGWDTHVNQQGRIAGLLKDVDAMIAALRTDLGPSWASTLVLVATEFGRTAAVNGTRGTDHGTASAVMMFGGGLAGGGQVLADWPGLGASQLYEGRDLKPTMRIERLLSDMLAAHYGIEPEKARRTLFPDFA